METSAQLTETQFQAEIAEFVTLVNEASNEKWTLHKSPNGIYAKQSVMVRWRKEVVNRQVHITYNPVYQVPVLWFNIYLRDGRPLSAAEALELAPNHNCTSELVKNVTQNEHPVLGILFYNVHPCNTPKIMQELCGMGNYICKWISVYGSPIGVSVPLSLFTVASSPCSDKPTVNCPSETSQSSDDGSV